MLGKIRYCIILSLCCMLSVFAETHPKIAYIKVQFPNVDSSLYVGQNIEVKYSLTLLSDAKILSTDLLDLSSKNNVALQNKNAKWRVDAQGVSNLSYVYNIAGRNVIIPPLLVKVSSSDGSYQEEVVAQGATFQAIDLSNNPNYINVTADMMEVVDYRVKEYDEQNNIVVFQFESKNAYLNAMKIAQYPKQGLEESRVVDGVTYGIYYVVLEKSLRSLSFDYFNLLQHQFVNITLPIQILQNVIEDDIKPRNTFLIFKNLLISAFTVFVALVWLVFKKIRKISFGILLLLILILLYNVFFKTTSGIAQVGANISIIPTYNSTTTEVVKIPTSVDIIGEYGDFYKIIMENKVGWIRKEHVKKN